MLRNWLWRLFFFQSLSRAKEWRSCSTSLADSHRPEDYDDPCPVSQAMQATEGGGGGKGGGGIRGEV